MENICAPPSSLGSEEKKESVEALSSPSEHARTQRAAWSQLFGIDFQEDPMPENSPSQQKLIAQHFKALADANPDGRLSVSQSLEQNRQYAKAQQIKEETEFKPFEMIIPKKIPSIFLSVY